MSNKKLRKKVKEIYLSEEEGFIFITTDDKEYVYKYYEDASGAISSIGIRELLHKGNKKCIKS